MKTQVFETPILFRKVFLKMSSGQEIEITLEDSIRVVDIIGDLGLRIITVKEKVERNIERGYTALGINFGLVESFELGEQDSKSMFKEVWERNWFWGWRRKK